MVSLDGRRPMVATVTKTGTYRYAFRWRRVPRCPGRLHAEVFGAEPLPAGVCVDYSKALLMIDEDGMPEPMLEGVCCCEVHDG